ncbi:hypothetical protein JHK85_009064 [Glycine max]|uniref:Uncharacterized protein n=2 Tax=Glycine subgen. Soja TaxID=1462606 RepID=K7KHP0_SOYBN|nr:hypothetical protein JHK85_009064 [Glycine max]KAG5065091.1 hypothetical protein JHK86_008822 [Glycine max]KAH1109376.1 hypothetical protein GYH30_008666 [Glycine max]RZC14600.1 hypothetical protein D0Y65_008517 [Glycine soja]
MHNFKMLKKVKTSNICYTGRTKETRKCPNSKGNIGFTKNGGIEIIGFLTPDASGN